MSGNRVSAVLCSTDLERSQKFYEDKVGLELSSATIKNHLVFEFGDLRMVDHVLTSPGIGKSAWFKDPDGSTLALFQPE
jgi:predicted enzyme related to lactoylglutathione lyase